MLKNIQAKILQAGLLAGIAIFILAVIEDLLSAGLYTSADPVIWKVGMAQNWWMYSFFYNIVVGLLLALAYSVFYGSLPGKGAVRGLQCGFWVWLVGTVPGLLMSLMSLNIPEELVIVWLVAGLFNYLIAGIIIGAMYRPQNNS